jgi:hypothetical protein
MKQKLLEETKIVGVYQRKGRGVPEKNQLEETKLVGVYQRKGHYGVRQVDRVQSEHSASFRVS